ncbi:MAG: hypothetical protein HY812_09950 [Planctomycetes bacterium]|nr:hypothetical protein [Planctomycetota bacterium]
MQELASVFGREQGAESLDAALAAWARRQGASPVELLALACCEAAAGLSRPGLGGRAPLLLANHGCRYEFGSILLAEQEAAPPCSGAAPPALLVRIFGHGPALAEDAAGAAAAGRPCAALRALLEGRSLPFVAELARVFRSLGVDRLAALVDGGAVPAAARPLFAAIANARLQARSACLDLLEHRPSAPALYLILHGVVLRGPAGASLLPCGGYLLDRRGNGAPGRYAGLGDDPARYRLSREGGRAAVADEGNGVARAMTDYRRWAGQERAALAWPDLARDERLRRFIDLARARGARAERSSAADLKVVLRLLAQEAPVQAALLLCEEGIAAPRHVLDLAGGAVTAARVRAAREILRATEPRLDELDEDRGSALFRALLLR